ncbi:MAG TPA: hypothetical protein VGK99_03990 [Acidobacteriota bacterium]
MDARNALQLFKSQNGQPSIKELSDEACGLLTEASSLDTVTQALRSLSPSVQNLDPLTRAALEAEIARRLKGLNVPNSTKLASRAVVPQKPVQPCNRDQNYAKHQVLSGCTEDNNRPATESDHATDLRICEALAKGTSILDRFIEDLSHQVAGEEKAAKLLFLILMSRFLSRPVSAAVKGPSSAGKSYLLESVLAFFPRSAYFTISAMSPKWLAYTDEPFQNRFIVLFELSGMEDEDLVQYLIRSLLSEGKIVYGFVDKGQNGLQSVINEREGPTGFLTTTTAISVHPENETRLLSIPVTDTAAQTRAVLIKIAEADGFRPDYTQWHALQRWLEKKNHNVVVPYARELAERIPSVATRLRRDFTAILGLIKSNAILHQASRPIDSEGRIVASISDYEAVKELVLDLVSSGIDATVSCVLRETVEALKAIQNPHGVTVAALSTKLGLDKSTVWRRVRSGIAKDYIKNLEDKRGRPARLVLGDDPLPDDIGILPPGCDLVASGCTTHATTNLNENKDVSFSGCTVAAETGGINNPPWVEPEVGPGGYPVSWDIGGGNGKPFESDPGYVASLIQDQELAE